MKKSLILIGTGENSVVIANILRNQFDVRGFLDDRSNKSSVLGPIADFPKFVGDCSFFVTIGNNRARLAVTQELLAEGATLVNAIHPTALVEPQTELASNVFVGARCIINVGSQIGTAGFVNSGCIVEHDTYLHPGVHLAPGVVMGGGVTVGSRSFIGLGARVNDHIKIGDDVIVGSGAVVLDHLPDGVTAVGVPAKVVKR